MPWQAAIIPTVELFRMPGRLHNTTPVRPFEKENLPMNCRSMTYGRELRAYESELSKAAALHQRAVSTKRGRVVFIAGQPKSGRTDLLMSLGFSGAIDANRQGR